MYEVQAIGNNNPFVPRVFQLGCWYRAPEDRGATNSWLEALMKLINPAWDPRRVKSFKQAQFTPAGRQVEHGRGTFCLRKIDGSTATSTFLRVGEPKLREAIRDFPTTPSDAAAGTAAAPAAAAAAATTAAAVAAAPAAAATTTPTPAKRKADENTDGAEPPAKEARADAGEGSSSRSSAPAADEMQVEEEELPGAPPADGADAVDPRLQLPADPRLFVEALRDMLLAKKVETTNKAVEIAKTYDGVVEPDISPLEPLMSRRNVLCVPALRVLTELPSPERYVADFASQLRDDNRPAVRAAALEALKRISARSCATSRMPSSASSCASSA